LIFLFALYFEVCQLGKAGAWEPKVTVVVQGWQILVNEVYPCKYLE